MLFLQEQVNCFPPGLIQIYPVLDRNFPHCSFDRTRRLSYPSFVQNMSMYGLTLRSRPPSKVRHMPLTRRRSLHQRSSTQANCVLLVSSSIKLFLHSLRQRRAAVCAREVLVCARFGVWGQKGFVLNVDLDTEYQVHTNTFACT